MTIDLQEEALELSGCSCFTPLFFSPLFAVLPRFITEQSTVKALLSWVWSRVTARSDWVLPTCLYLGSWEVWRIVDFFYRTIPSWEVYNSISHDADWSFYKIKQHTQLSRTRTWFVTNIWCNFLISFHFFLLVLESSCWKQFCSSGPSSS